MTAPSLARKTFTVSRLAEFASTAELVKTTGHPVERWPLVIVKELIDNAIDAAEGANVAPVVDVAVESGGSIVVTDGGPGVPPELVANLVDYSKRTSSRAAYVTRVSVSDLRSWPSRKRWGARSRAATAATGASRASWSGFTEKDAHNRIFSPQGKDRAAVTLVAACHGQH